MCVSVFTRISLYWDACPQRSLALEGHGHMFMAQHMVIVFTLVRLLSLLLLRLYELFRCRFDLLDPRCPTDTEHACML